MPRAQWRAGAQRVMPRARWRAGAQRVMPRARLGAGAQRVMPRARLEWHHPPPHVWHHHPTAPSCALGITLGHHHPPPRSWHHSLRSGAEARHLLWAGRCQEPRARARRADSKRADSKRRHELGPPILRGPILRVADAKEHVLLLELGADAKSAWQKDIVDRHLLNRSPTPLTGLG